jgi:hypothetical protein
MVSTTVPLRMEDAQKIGTGATSAGKNLLIVGPPEGYLVNGSFVITVTAICIPMRRGICKEGTAGCKPHV